MIKRIRWGWVFALLALSGLALSIIKAVAAGPANLARPADIEKAKAEVRSPGNEDERSPLAPRGYVSGNGVIEPVDRETRVAGLAPGRVAVIRAKEGDRVEVGVPLVELESNSETAALEAAEAEVAVQAAVLARTANGLRKEDVDALIGEAEAARARAQLSAEILARTEHLVKSGAATLEELDRARRQAEADQRIFNAADARRRGGVNGARRDDVRVARAQLQAAVARREQARTALERLTIRAPIAGTVLQVKYRAGEYYNPAAIGGASADPLVVMGDTRRLRARIDVDERDVARVKLGASGYIALSAFRDRRFPGQVVEIGKRMGRKNVRTDDPVERLDVKILEVVMQLEKSSDLVPGIRVTAYIDSSH